MARDRARAPNNPPRMTLLSLIRLGMFLMDILDSELVSRLDIAFELVLPTALL